MGRNFFDREIAALEALDAIDDPNIEKSKIPRVYYHGLPLPAAEKTSV